MEHTQKRLTGAQFEFDSSTGIYSTTQMMIRYEMDAKLASSLSNWGNNKKDYENERLPKVSEWYESLSEHEKKQVKVIDLSKIEIPVFVSSFELAQVRSRWEGYLPQKGFHMGDTKKLEILEAGIIYRGAADPMWSSIQEYWRSIIFSPDYKLERPTVADWYDILEKGWVKKFNIERIEIHEPQPA